MAFYNYPPLTVASGETTSNAIDLQGHTFSGIIMPDAFTGTSLTFAVSRTFDGDYTTLYKDGADFSVAVEASKSVVLQPADFTVVNFLKVISSSAEGADRTLLGVSRVIQ